MKKYIRDYCALGIILLGIGGFFFRLFWPVPQLIVTPDFGQSDAFNSSYSTKYALWQSRQNGTLPLWNSSIGGGFPLLAEGQAGALFLPNLILFSLPDPVISYNLALFSAFLTLGWGMYWCMRVLGFLPASSVFGALSLTFSSLPVLHLTHGTLLQGISLTPFLFGLTHRILTGSKHHWTWVSIWAIVGVQQILAGFPQGVFLTYSLCIIYALWLLRINIGIGPIIRQFAAMALSVGIGMAQLLPSGEFLQATVFPDGFSATGASLYSMPFKHLVTFLWPYALGNPKAGTYPPFYEFDGSIFWENTAFIGWLPLLFFIVSVKKRKNIVLWNFCFIITVLSLLFAWGKYSPLYFIFGMWPFTLFRVPSRYLWIVCFAVITLSAAGFDAVFVHIKKPVFRLGMLLLVILNTALLMYVFWDYHLIVPAKDWLNISQPLLTVSGRLFTVGERSRYNHTVESAGWLHQLPYWYFREGMSPNSNLVWNISHADSLSGRQLRRPQFIVDLIEASIEQSDRIATMSSNTERFMDLANIGTIASFIPITAYNGDSLYTTRYRGETLNVYQRVPPPNRAYIVYTATEAATLKEAAHILQENLSIPRDSVLMESHQIASSDALATHIKSIQELPVTNQSARVTIQQETAQTLRLTVEANTHPGILVLADTYYPGWQAEIDGVRTPVYTANVSQRAILIPRGDHSVTFSYKPDSFYTGLRISIGTLMVTILLGAVPFVVSAFHTRQKKIWQIQGPRRNHDA